MTAVRFQADADLLADERRAARLLAALYRRIPANKHSRATMPTRLPETLQAAALSDPRLEKGHDGRVQFGTLGRGNHFLEFQADREGQVWLMVHSGSRAIGQAITAHHSARVYLAALRGRSTMPSRTVWSWLPPWPISWRTFSAWFWTRIP